MYAQLGNIQFTPVKGFTGLTQSEESNLPQHARIEGKPRLQKIGDNLFGVAITMLFDIAFCNPQTEIDALRSARANAEVMPLLMGDGTFLGDYVIASLEVTHTNAADNGRVLQAEVSVSLVEFADADPQASFDANAVSQAFANFNNQPPTYIPAAPIVTTQASAMQGVVVSTSEMNTSGDVLLGIQAVASQYRVKADNVLQSMLATANQLDEVLAVIDADPASEVYSRTRDLAQRIGEANLLLADVVSEATALIDDIDNGITATIPARIIALTLNGTQLKTKAGQILTAAASLTALTIVQ